MTAAEHLQEAIDIGCTRDDHDHVQDHRDEVRREVLGDDLNPSELVRDAAAYRRLADDIAATMDDPDRWDGDEPEDMVLGRYVKWLAAGRPPLDGEQVGKDIGDGTQPPADESTQPTPLTDAHTAFAQLLSTPALQGLRAELRIDGHPALIGTYCGAGTRMANHQPSVLLIEPMLAFEYTEGGDA